MGNADLRQVGCFRSLPLADLAGETVAVDAHNWLYKYLTTTVKFTDESTYTTADGQEVANLIGIVQGLPKFLEHDITPVFVFDGVPTDLKADEIEERREAREQAQARLKDARERGDAVEIARLESRTQRLTDVIHETTRGLLSRLDIPIVEAPAEGEAQAAYMARHDESIDYAGSDDYDTLLFGAPLTLRQLTSAGDPEVMDLAATLDAHDITWEQLVDVGILCGTDFNEGVTGIGPKTALKLIDEHGDLWSVLEAEGATIDHADRVRELFLQPTVSEGYTIDLAIEPDLDAARTYVTEEWGVAAEEVDRGFGRIEDATTQTGLDQFT
ncbi:MAG: flap endonuclease-1 [Halobacteriales archaeon]|nr:flap endonuclease-1 [Halobacteriales archaeon]